MSKSKNFSDSISPTFCILPWIHSATKVNGQIRLCCFDYADSESSNEASSKRRDKVGDSSLSENWNSELLRAVRKKMLAGEKPSSCTLCFREEASEMVSKRIWETNHWSNQLDIAEIVARTGEDGSLPINIKYLDLRFGNACNLRCTMCSPIESSAWKKDWLKIHESSTSNFLQERVGVLRYMDESATSDGWFKEEKFWNSLIDQIPNLKQLYFAGGEPTLHKSHYQLLEECIQRGHASNISLRYNSNGTYLPASLLETWKHFKFVKYGLSIDSIEEMNSYIRYPSKWENILKTLDDIENSSENVVAILSTTVQAMNVYYLPELIKWKIRQNYKKVSVLPYSSGLVNMHLLHQPSHLSIKIFPAPIKDAIRDKLEKLISWLENEFRDNEEFQKSTIGIRKLRGIIDFMYSENCSHHFPTYIEYIDRIDAVRGLSYANNFPEFYSLLIPYIQLSDKARSKSSPSEVNHL